MPEAGAMRLPWRRVLLKLSGEVLMGDRPYGISARTIGRIADEILEARELGVELAVVIGGGNIFRGVAAASEGMDRVSADYVGMLATCINSLVLQDALEKVGLTTRVMTAIEMRQLAETYIRRRALRHLEKGRIVIFAAGTGNPFFTTDTAAALRAVEIKADVVLKGTMVDGVYDRDPRRYPDARRYRSLTYIDVLNQHLQVMDSTAITLCMENALPVFVFNLCRPGNIPAAVRGESVGTIVQGGPEARSVFEDEEGGTRAG